MVDSWEEVSGDDDGVSVGAADGADESGQSSGTATAGDTAEAEDGAPAAPSIPAVDDGNGNGDGDEQQYAPSCGLMCGKIRPVHRVLCGIGVQ